MTGEEQLFSPPLFQTWIMFVGMTFALPMYFGSEWYKRYKAQGDPAALAAIEAEPKVTTKTYILLAVPSVFDLIATVLMVFGLLHINASIWMLLRGGGIVFVALMKNYILKDKLKPSMWAGVGVIGVAVLMVGYSSQIGAKAEKGAAAAKADATDAAIGVLMTMLGTFVQSVQYTYEEKVMSGDIAAPPWLLIGMEGLCGTLICTVILYPLAYLCPGPDNGSFENPYNTLVMLQNSPTAVALSVTFCSLVFVLNSFSVLVTYMMSSVWHAILDNFRPISIWIVELMLYYSFKSTRGQFGEAWTMGSWLQLAGMCVLLVGTAIYNGTIQVPGLAKHDLIATSSYMSSPALSRSPLITANPSAQPTFGGAHATSPYAARPRLAIDDAPMVGGHGAGAGNLKQSLLVKDPERGRR